jgi:DNA-binding SARP family transcriptional activator/WD40 repeat protein
MGIEVRVSTQFRVLGPLEASHDGVPIRLGGERQRALLALLVTHANALVTTERLIEHLFGGAPSHGAANAVHVAVSRLRRALRCGDEALLVTRPGGYVLCLGPDQLDATRFERLLEEGRQAVAAGDPGAGAVRLREALALWRGPALADLALMDFIAPEARRLDELRLLALMERIDADLALGRHAELIPELEALVAAEPLRERLRQQQMLALYRADRRAEALEVYRATSALLREELGLEPTRTLQDLERMVLRQDESLGGTPPVVARPATPDPLVCPFKGLASFDTGDAEYFCGRDRVVSELVARAAESTLVGILGPSGIGKSSLLRAGLLPALKSGALPGSAGWRQVLLRPGSHPCEELDRALGGPGLDEALRRLGPTEGLVIAVDQLEELFTQGASEEERARFLGRLAAAAREPDRRVLVLCALRADFYGRIGAHPCFAELLSHSHALVGPMDREELTEAIERPAARAGLSIEHTLVDALVADVADEPGGLPLLSTALLELWRARDGHTLPFDAYRRSGGVRGAVGRLAEAAYAQLTEPERRAARNVLLRLVAGEPGALARRRVPLAELQRVNDGERVLATLIDARLITVGDGNVELSHEALVREWPRYRAWLDDDQMGRRIHAHLIAAAREWDMAGRDPGELYRGARLANALEWTARNREWLNPVERAFIDTSRLEARRDLQRQRAHRRRLRNLAIAAGALLLLAIGAAVFALVKQNSADDAARAAAADARAALGRQLGTEAVSEPSLDLAMLLARQAVTLNRSEQTEGSLLATLLRTPAVMRSFALAPGAPNRLALSPDGGTLAVGDADAGTIRFYDPVTRVVTARRLADFSGDQPPVYSADGALLVYPTEQAGGQRLDVRDARTLALRRQLTPDAGFEGESTADIPQGSIAVDPGGHFAVYAYWALDAAGRPGAAYLDRWSLPGGRLTASLRIGTGPLVALRLTDDGRQLVTVSAHAVSVFDTVSLQRLRTVDIPADAGAPAVAAISPDGRRVVLGGRRGAVWFEDTVTGAVREGAGTHHAAVVGAFFGPAGEAATTVGNDNTVIVWDARTATPAQELSGPTGQVQSAAGSADGTTLYTSSLDGDVLAWDLTGTRQFGRRAVLGAGLRCCTSLAPQVPPLATSPDGSELAVRVGASTVGVFSTRTLERRASFRVDTADGITGLAWSPTAPVVAVAGHAGFVQLWNVAGTPRPAQTMLGLHAVLGRPEAIQALAFSPDGSLLAASDRNETHPTPDLPALPAAFLATWRTDTGTLVGAPRELEVGAGAGRSDQLAFSPDGSLLAAGVPDGRVLVLDTASGATTQTLSPPSGATALAFAANGTLATGTAAGTVDLWNPATGQALAPALIAASAPITSLAFEPGGRRFVTAGYQDGSVKLWFMSTLQQEGPSLRTDTGTAATVAFAAHGHGVLAVQDTGLAVAWPTSLSDWERRACQVAGRNFTREEWVRLVAQPRYAPVCRRSSAGRWRRRLSVPSPRRSPTRAWGHAAGARRARWRH